MNRAWILAAVCAAIAVGGAVVQTSAITPPTATSGAPSSADQSKPTPQPTVTAPPSSTPREKKAATEAAAAAKGVVGLANRVLAAGTRKVPKELSKIADGFVEGEIRAMALEREQEGYRQVGEAEITSIAVRSAHLDASPPTVELDVCIDSSGIDVVDENGNSLKGTLYYPGHPVLNVYGAELVGGTWKITTHTIPTDGKCK